MHHRKTPVDWAQTIKMHNSSPYNTATANTMQSFTNKNYLDTAYAYI